MRLIPFLLLPVLLVAKDEKHPLPESERKEMQTQFKEAISHYTERLSKSPKEVGL